MLTTRPWLRSAVEAGTKEGADQALAHGALVPAALSLLVYALQPPAIPGERDTGVVMYEAICVRLFRSPSAAAFLDAMFDSVRTQLRMVNMKIPSRVLDKLLWGNQM